MPDSLPLPDSELRAARYAARVSAAHLGRPQHVIAWGETWLICDQPLPTDTVLIRDVQPGRLPAAPRVKDAA